METWRENGECGGWIKWGIRNPLNNASPGPRFKWCVVAAGPVLSVLPEACESPVRVTLSGTARAKGQNWC